MTLNSKKELFLTALATTVLETDPATLTLESRLDPWDSLAVVNTIMVLDDIYGKQVSGRALGACETVGDILKLVEQA